MISGKKVKVLAGGPVNDRWLGKMRPVKHHPAKIRLTDGIRGMSERVVEWIVQGSGKVTVALDCVKGGRVEKEVRLR